MTSAMARDYQDLTRIRLEEPEAVRQAAAGRRRHPGPAWGRQNFIIAADHPARGALAAGGHPMAMADRRELLDRLRTALADPAVDGVLGTADIIEDLLLLGALDGKLIFGSMNRGGLAGLVNEIDDRFTGYTAAALADIGADGGKMLTRICYSDPATVRTVEACAQAVDSLHERGLIAMVEPFISERAPEAGEGHRFSNNLTTEAVIRSMAIAAGLGAGSARTWLKVPVVRQMERVVAATTLPMMLLGGDSSEAMPETFARWQEALRLPGVQGLTVGRSVLYPANDDVTAAVTTAASLLQREPEEQTAPGRVGAVASGQTARRLV